ncbi:MAG: arsenate reductase/protein-tyrosine-phosphatase family protein [Candidatus Hodarchaeales archaeon]
MKAIYKIELIENSDELSDFIKLESTLLKGKIYNDLEQQSLSKSALEELWSHLTELKNQYYQIEIYFILLQIYIQSNDKANANQMLDSAELILKILDSVSSSVQTTYQSYFIFLVGLYHLKVTNDTQQALYNFNDCLENFTNDNNDLGVIQSNFWLGSNYFRQRDYEIAINFFWESLDFAEKVNNKYYIAKNHHFIGKIYSEQENWDESLKKFEISLEYCRELYIPSLLVKVLHDTIEMLFQFDYWDKLELYLAERLKHTIDNKMVTDIISSYYWFAYYYEYRGMVDEALSKYQETLEYLNKIQYLDEIHRCSAHISFLNAKKFGKLENRDWKKELLNHKKPWRIVIVCNGNISRSPFTELILKKWFEEQNSDLYKNISIESLGVLYRNKKIHSLSKSFLLDEGVNEDNIIKHKPRYWKDFPGVCEQASIIVTTTGEQANLVNFFYPGKAFMLSYVAEEKFNSIIDPALHRKDAEKLFRELKRLTLLFSKKLVEIL